MLNQKTAKLDTRLIEERDLRKCLYYEVCPNKKCNGNGRVRYTHDETILEATCMSYVPKEILFWRGDWNNPEPMKERRI